MRVDWLAWSLLIAAAIHMTEEFAWPGGFRLWYAKYRANAVRVTPLFLLTANAILLAGCVYAALPEGFTPHLAAWFGVGAILFMNGLWHQYAAYKSHTYSPGMVTGLLIYVLLVPYGYHHYLHAGSISITTAVIAAAVGGSYQFWSALYHGAFKRVPRGPIELPRSISLR
jgi:hypothetical protein